MRLARSVSIDETAQRLAKAIEELEELGHSPLPLEYLAWADECENRLCAVFAEPDIRELLHTDRYWYLHRHDETDDRWVNTNVPVPDPCGQEATTQLAHLKALAAQVDRLRALAERAGRVLVYDTNALMHYQPPDMISWTALVKTHAVRLVIPLVVIDELDRKQHEGSKDMSQRARRALHMLDQALDGADPSAAVPLPNRPAVSIEVLMDEAGHSRTTNADDEIIERGVLLAQITGAPVTVVTADTGMRLRAEAAGLNALRLPKSYGKDQ